MAFGILDQVFVAMSFEPRFVERYDRIIRPAIEGEALSGFTLRAHRVDNSKTGDSMLSDIVDGIAHSRLVLADVSVVDEGRFTQAPVRNGNVMYEVGIALACRSSMEVLLVRDDSKRFLFDVSTIPRVGIDFSTPEAAISQLREAISDRLSESRLVEDARVKMAVQTVTQIEVAVLRKLAQAEAHQYFDLSYTPAGQLTFPD